MTVFMPEPHILLTVVPAPLRQSRAERRLPRRRLALSGRQHAAHQHFGDIVGREAGAPDRCLDRDAAEFRRRTTATARPESRPWPCAPCRR